jgi:hypothetical protein
MVCDEVVADCSFDLWIRKQIQKRKCGEGIAKGGKLWYIVGQSGGRGATKCYLDSMSIK